MTDFNSMIRSAARRGAPASVPDQEPPVGSIGIGVGGCCRPAQPESGSQRMNDVLRRSARIARSFTVPGGVNIDTVNLDDLYGR